MIICFYLLYVKNADMLSLYKIGIKNLKISKWQKWHILVLAGCFISD